MLSIIHQIAKHELERASPLLSDWVAVQPGHATVFAHRTRRKVEHSCRLILPHLISEMFEGEVLQLATLGVVLAVREGDLYITGLRVVQSEYFTY